MRKSLISLLLGIIIGVIAASLYWRGTVERSKFLFDQNVKCQDLARQYEARANTRTRLVIVVSAAYSPGRNSCVAEVRKAEGGGIDYTVEDLISGDFLFYKHLDEGKNGIDPKTMIEDQDARFTSLAR